MDELVALEVNEVTKRYGSQTVLDKISFSLNKGEVVGLVGPNGAGKTTIMSIITGLVKNYSGQVLIDGRDIKDKRRVKEKYIGCVIDTPGLYPNMTGLENLRFFSHFFGNVSEAEIVEIVKMLGLENSVNKTVKKYSFGMRQRLGIAQAVLGYPKLVILDEPTNGLDPNIIPGIRQFIKYISAEKGITVLISSHILTEIEAMCDKALLIKSGSIIEQLQIRSVETNDSVPFVFETTKATELQVYFKEISISSSLENSHKVIALLHENEIESTVTQLIQKGITIKSIYKQKTSLEDKFLKSIGENKVE